MPRLALAAAGIFFTLLAIAGIIYLILRTVKSRRVRAEEEKPIPVQEDPIAGLRSRYDALYITHEVPHNAMIVRMACNNYSSAGAALRHYCWVNDGIMMLFPLWESLVGAGGELVSPEMNPREWRIPVADIVCYAIEQGLPNKFVVLQIKQGADVMNLAFDDDSARVFAILFPEKDFTHLLEELYPKSSRNIRDIRENFQSLKELREEDLITEDEYAAKKKEMLILM